MAEDNEVAGTTEEGTEAQAEAPVTQTAPDEVTTLRSRNAGLDAKVTELMKAQAAAEAKAAEALKKLQEYEEGKASESEAARAQIERLSAELAQATRTAQVNALKAQYPESFSVYGDAIAGMSEDVLAAGEARLRGIPAESNTPPTPVGINPTRTAAPANKPIEEMSLAELKEYGARAFPTLTWADITQE